MIWRHMFDDATVHSVPFIPFQVKVHLLVQDSSVHYLQYLTLERVWKSRCLSVSTRCRFLCAFIHPSSCEMGTTAKWYIYLYDEMIVIVKMLGVLYIFCKFKLIFTYKGVIKDCRLIFLQSGASVDKRHVSLRC